MPARAIIALGSNLKEPKAQVRLAMRQLNRVPSTLVVKQSSLYLTKPVGVEGQPDFINAVALVDTFLAPHDLMRGLLDIEASHGRHRIDDSPLSSEPRTLDLDLITYDDLVLQTASLTLPHPRAFQRAFVLVPLAEIAPDLVIPGHGVVSSLLAKVNTSGVALVRWTPTG
jgi:2-amino-4-hydroxy-6-hydroxymethyldihydropteridine diphosphokinase